VAKSEIANWHLPVGTEDRITWIRIASYWGLKLRPCARAVEVVSVCDVQLHADCVSFWGKSNINVSTVGVQFIVNIHTILTW